MSSARDWFGALRPWSLTAATVPVLVGAAAAALDGHFTWGMLALTLLCGWLLQTAVNLLNLYGDFKSGVDNPESVMSAPQLVEGKVPLKPVFWLGVATLVAAAALGVVIAALSGWRLLLLAAVGVAGAGCYTTGLRYKYIGLGVPLVFFLMGVLMVLASYFAQTGTYAWQPALVSIPVSFLVAAIMHGNDLRDMASDGKCGIVTTALALGAAKGHALYRILHIGPYVAVAAGVAAGWMPAWTLLTFLVLPLNMRTLRDCAAGFHDGETARLARLEGSSAGIHFIFGIVLTLGLALTLLTQR